MNKSDLIKNILKIFKLYIFDKNDTLRFTYNCKEEGDIPYFMTMNKGEFLLSSFNTNNLNPKTHKDEINYGKEILLGNFIFRILEIIDNQSLEISLDCKYEIIEEIAKEEYEIILKQDEIKRIIANKKIIQ